MTASIQPAAGRFVVAGSMTLETASALLASGVSALGQGDPVFDLAAVDDVDSSGLAVLFGWQRAAQEQGKALRVVNPPHNLISLAEVYGVADLLPLS
jgi:phospholipid transport system transporter-binding protein